MITSASEALEALHLGDMQVRNAPEGQRNDTLNRVAYHLGSAVGDSHLERAQVDEVLEEAALASGLDIDEARSTIRSGLNAGIVARYNWTTKTSRLLSPNVRLLLTPWQERQFVLTRWFDKRSPRSGERFEVTRSEIVDMFACPEVLPDADASAKDSVAMWTAGEFEDGYRSNKSARRHDLVLLDLDDGGVTGDDLDSRLHLVSYIAHTTYSHTPDAPRWRVAILTSRSMFPEEYRIVWHYVAERIPGVDMTTGDPGRAYFVPVERPGHEYLYIDGTSDLVLDVDAILAASKEGAAPEAAPLAPELPAMQIGRLEELLPGDWLTQPPTERPTLLALQHPLYGHERALFPLGKTAMIAGAGGTSKTMLVISLTISVVTGRPWLGLFGVASPGDILLVVAEEDLEEIARRMQLITRTMDLTEDERLAINQRIHLVPAYGCDVRFGDSPRNSTMAARLEEYMSNSGASFAAVIVDPASRIMGGSAEIDASEATRFVEALERLTGAPGGPCVLVTHHVSKSAMRSDLADQGAPRGSSALVDGVRTLLLVERVNLFDKGVLVPPGVDVGRGDFLKLHVAKSNYTAPFTAPFWVRIAEDGVLHSLGQRASQRITVAMASRSSKRQALDDGYGDNEFGDDEFAGLS